MNRLRNGLDFAICFVSAYGIIVFLKDSLLLSIVCVFFLISSSGGLIERLKTKE